MRLHWILTLFLPMLCASGLCASEVTTLTGTVYRGTVKSLDSKEIEIETDTAQTIQVSTQELMNVSFSSSSKKPKTSTKAPFQITLTDRSKISGSSLNSDGKSVTIENPILGSLQIPPSNVKSVLFKTLDSTTSEQWEKLIKGKNRDDLLVIKKGDTLDYLSGIVTQFNNKNVMFLYEGNEIPVRLEKVFGIVHPHPLSPPEQAICRLETTSGDSLFVQSVELKGNSLELRTGPKHSISVPRSEVRLLDFSLGRIVYLSDMPVEGVEYTPFFDTVWEFQRDQTIDRKPLKLGNKEYKKGLLIHSKTKLTYRLAGEFSRFQALMGIDASVAQSGLGHVHVKITADEKVLVDQNVDAFTEISKLDLNVKGHRFLTILVDFGEGLNIGDRLDLVEAKLIK